MGKGSRKSSSHELKSVATAGYSGTPLPKKLGIRENYSVVLINAPVRFERKLEPLPDGAEIGTEADSANVAVVFATSQAYLVRDFGPLAKGEFGLGEGWVDYKVCAIDETWSGLCFARRR